MQFVIKNTLAKSFALICNTILIFFQIKILTNFLSCKEYGSYVTLVFISIVISSFITFGLPSVLLRFVAKYEALNDKKGLSFILFFPWFIVFLSSSIIVFLVYYFSFFFSSSIFSYFILHIY